MSTKTMILGPGAYILVTFPLAVVWHMLLFEQKYMDFGYFEENPDFMFAFLSMLVQGVILTFLYPMINFRGGWVVRSFKFSATVGLFFWTSHVLAFMAKHPSDASVDYMLMETIFLSLQFGISGIILGFIHRKPAVVTV